MEELYGDVLAVWQSCACTITGYPIDSSHHVAEDAPDALARAIASFLEPDNSPR